MEACSRWDHPAVLASLTDDVEWVDPGAFHLVGREAFDKEIEGQGAAGLPEIVVTRLIEKDDAVMAFRDVHTARHHGWVSETRYGIYGQIALGLEPDFPVALFGPTAEGE
jgi:hypothetical protein